MKPPAKPTGYLLHRGITNGEPFIVIATLSSANVKTGDMVQTWILLENVNPVEGVKTGIDAKSICRECPFASGNGCYVNVGQAPLGIFRAYHRGSYPTLNPSDYAAIFGGRAVRFGAYGNPSLIPLSIVKSIAAVSSGWTGYFHDWRTNPLAAEYAKFFMASTETKDSLALALSLRFRVFHASPIKPDGLRECLSETHQIECKDCKLCCGTAKASQRSIWINPHGTKVAKANAAALA
jgi:hypothetical protein